MTHGQERYGIGSGAPRQQNLSIPFHQSLVDTAIFEYLSDGAAAFRTRKPMLITSVIIVQLQAMILTLLSLAPSWRPSSRGMLSPSSLLTLLYDFGQIHNWPYLNRSKSKFKAWLLGDKLNGVIEVSRLQDLNAAKLFLGFRIRAIRGRDFAVFPVQGHGGPRRL